MRKATELAAVGGHNGGFATRITMARGDVTGVATLLEKLFNQTQGNPKTPGNHLPRAFVIVVGSQNTFAQSQRGRSHEPRLPHPI